MTIVEVLLYLVSSALLGMIFTRKSISKQYIFIVFNLFIIMLVVDLIFYGLKWQLYPLILGGILLVVITYLKLVKQLSFARWVRRTSMIVLSILIGISLLTTYVFPVGTIPQPDGPYLIGTQSFVLTENQPELYTSNPDDDRRFKIQIWYPAESVEGYQLVPWLEEVKISQGA